MMRPLEHRRKPCNSLSGARSQPKREGGVTENGVENKFRHIPYQNLHATHKNQTLKLKKQKKKTYDLLLDLHVSPRL